MKAFRLVLFLLCLPLLGCAISNKIVKVKTVKVAILPEYSLYLISQKYGGLLDYLSKETGYRFELVTAMDYRSFLSTVEGSGAELSLQNALIFRQLRKTKKARTIAASLGRDGLLTGRGIIVVRRDSGIDDVRQLKGKVVMVPAREAVLGYVAQAVQMLKSGLDVEKDLTIVLGVRHDEVLRNVWLGRVDAGFVKTAVLAEAAGRVNLNELKVLGVTEPFPNWCFAAFPNSDPVMVEKVKNALLDMNWEDPEQKPILQAASVKGFVDPSKLDLEPIDQAVEALHLPY
jgi:ABC-type phosphate/phosphonate transport system substrate-binding protein